MGNSRYDAAARGRAAWNAGKTVGQPIGVA